MRRNKREMRRNKREMTRDKREEVARVYDFLLIYFAEAEGDF